jgi:hypothetical protein
MTAKELEAILLSAEYKQNLEEMSSYLESIKQERPIIYCLARFLWKEGRVFQLEDKRRDMVVEGAHVEFKYSFDCDMARLKDELNTYANVPLQAMWDDVKAGKLSKSWGAMPKIYEDMCVKKVRNRLADVFVWVICARDLTQVGPDARKRICWSIRQCEWSEDHPFSDVTYLEVADSFLERIRKDRPFAVLKSQIDTKGLFPSTYHLRICDFTSGEASTTNGVQAMMAP